MILGGKIIRLALGRRVSAEENILIEDSIVMDFCQIKKAGIRKTVIDHDHIIP